MAREVYTRGKETKDMAEIIRASHSATADRISERRSGGLRRVGRGLGITTLGLAMSPSLVAHAVPTAGDTPERPAFVYAALGDSYAAGESGDPYDPGTDIPGVNECHRSSQAYPHVLAKKLGATLVHVACSRATIDAAYAPAWNEPAAQVDYLNDETDLVTIGIGGNEADLATTLKSCLFNSKCGPDTEVYQRVMQTFDSDEFRAKLDALYTLLLERAPNARIVVVPYPLILQERSPMSPCTVMGREDDKAVEQMITALNDSIATVVREIDDSRLSMAQVLVMDPCSLQGNSKINWFPSLKNLRHPENFAHPTAEGQRALAEDVERTLQPPVD